VANTREQVATANTTNNWTISTTAATSQIAADSTRVSLTMVNIGTATVYLRFDSTAPTALIHHWRLDSNDRYEVPDKDVTFAVSMLGSAANGSLISKLGTA
jgi:hypothetical protein